MSDRPKAWMTLLLFRSTIGFRCEAAATFECSFYGEKSVSDHNPRAVTKIADKPIGDAEFDIG